MALSTWYDLGRNYRYRVDRPVIDSQPEHIHIQTPKGKEWKQRADGSPYEETADDTLSGDPPKWIREKLLEDKDNHDNNKKGGGGTGGPGWDWDGNKEKYEQKKGSDTQKAVTEVVTAGGVAAGGYLLYRGLRLLLSIPCPPTLIPNLVTP